MRLAWVFVLAAACGASHSNDPSGGGFGGGDDGGGGYPADASAVISGGPECGSDGDCQLAAASCCACPTYAMPLAEDICAGVDCPSPGSGSDSGSACPTNIHAACVSSACVLACNVVECDQSCADGFVLDSDGCATCACVAVDDRACTTGSDCSEVPADCCGCSLGGSDTAVPTTDVAAWQAGLDCPQNPACPGVDTCNTALAPACIGGACALVPPLPANACGRSDLPACGSGTVCALNADASATAQGVGVCVPST